MKLPQINIIAFGASPEEKLDSIAKLEPILAWLGYRPDNDTQLNYEMSDEFYLNNRGVDMIAHTYDDGTFHYLCFLSAGVTTFSANRVDDIVSYVLKETGRS